MSDNNNPRYNPWDFLNKVTAAWTIGTIIVSLISGIGGAYFYIRTLLDNISILTQQVVALQQQVSTNTAQITVNSSITDSLTKALSFGEKFTPQPVTFNGTRADTLCPAGQVMRGIRIGSWGHGRTEIRQARLIVSV
jgi:hypothetical protein